MAAMAGKSWADFGDDVDEPDQGRKETNWVDSVVVPEQKEKVSTEVEVRRNLRQYHIEHDTPFPYDHGEIQLARSVRRREYMRGNEDDFYHGNHKLFELPNAVRHQIQKMHTALQESKPVADPTPAAGNAVPGTPRATGADPPPPPPAPGAGLGGSTLAHTTLSQATASQSTLGQQTLATASGRPRMGAALPDGGPGPGGASQVYVPRHLRASGAATNGALGSRPGQATGGPSTGQFGARAAQPGAADIARVQQGMGFGQARLPAYAATQWVGQRTLADDYTVRVTNIGDTCSETALRELFRDAGDIAKVYHPRNIDGPGGDGPQGRKFKGFAFITYSTREGAQRAIQKFNNFGMDHLVMHVEWAQARPPR